MEGYACDVICVTFECDHRVGISRFDVVEFDVVPARGGEIFLVGSDAQSVDLRFRVLDCA